VDTVKEALENSERLQTLLEKSKRRRYRLLNKNREYCECSKTIRNQELKQPYPLKRMERGRKRFPILLWLIRARLFLDGVKIIKLNALEIDNVKRPIIFVPTHIGKFDIEVAYSCINEHALLLSGTEERMHGSADGIFLEMNGVNYVDRTDKLDRGNSVKKMQRDLEHGFNLLWFIEGTWNLSANRLVYPLSWSVVKLALQCDAVIVPMGFNQIGKIIYVKFGAPFRPDADREPAESILELRDILATLKWDIYEYIGQTRRDGFFERASLDKEYWERYLYERIREWPMTDLMEEMEYVFQPKSELEKEFGGNRL